MNDRFKFRIWNKEQQKLYSWNDLKKSKGDNSFYWCMLQAQNDEKNNILMQCTGLKDKNDKLIYEGDILKRPVSYPKNSYFYEVVIWERKRWQLARPQKCNCQFPQKQCKHCEKIPERKNYFFQNNDTSFKNFYESEVIGNIYENKELLDERN